MITKIGKKHGVGFWIGNQGFILDYKGTKSEAKWMAKMLKKALKNL